MTRPFHELERRCTGTSRLQVAAWVLVGLSFSSRADAQSEPVALGWSAPPGCPSAAEVAREIARIHGAVPRRAPVRAQVAVAQGREAGWTATVDLTDGAMVSHRVIEGESCQGVADAVSLIVALAVDPHAGEEAPDGSSAAAEASGKEASASPAPPGSAAAHPQADASSAQTVMGIGAGLLVDGSSLPRPSAGALVRGSLDGVGHRRVHLEAEVAVLPPVRGETAERRAAGADFWLLRGTARGCFALLERALDVLPCVGGGVERVAGTGFGSTSPSSATPVLGFVTAGAQLVYRISPRFSGRGGLDAHVPFTRPPFVIEGIGVVHRPSAVSLNGTVGVDFHF